MSATPYADVTAVSRALFQRAARVMPAGVSYAIRDLSPHPFYVDRAAGCRLTDVDGNVYTDYWLGHGALLLGHAPECVVAAVRHQLARGTHFGLSHALEVELAELVTTAIPGAEMVRYTNSGTEASMYAVGLARTYTGRTKIGKVEGGWHGGYDPLRRAVRPPFDVLEAGLDPRALGHTIAFPFNDLERAAAAIAGGELACVIVEPMLGAAGFIPAEAGYLDGLRSLCDDHGTLLVFDEVITGFRLGLGGAQALYGVTPDLTVLGKILGGGFPIGAICGRREIFDRLDHRRFPDVRQRAFHGGTFAANPISMAAGLATLRALQDGRVYGHLERLGEQIRTGLARIFSEAGIDAAVTGLKSTFSVHFRKGAPRDAREAAEGDAGLARRYHDAMLARRIAYLTPAVPHTFLSAAHSERDVAELLAATAAFARGCHAVACNDARAEVPEN
jgi:glutamate-1-semialdehyde 2,1-aminomutase